MKYALNLPNLTSKDVLPHLIFLGKGHYELDMAFSINYGEFNNLVITREMSNLTSIFPWWILFLQVGVQLFGAC
jgi:hypothetical protein